MASVLEAPVSAERASATRRATPAVKVWAWIGALILTCEAVVLIRWLAGPYFKRVPGGVTAEPGWMRAAEDSVQTAGVFAVAFCVYWCLIRPWRRDRSLTTDGLMVLALATLWFEDPLSNYFGQWFTYNANLVNFGSWVKGVPGWVSYAQPGHMVVEPIILIPCVYVYFILLGAMIGCTAMRVAERRRPTLSVLQLMLVCFLTMCAFDVVGEGLIILPLGFWEYPGGTAILFPSTYHKFPLQEMLTLAATFTAISSVRYFRDDHGRTIVERGADKLKRGRTPARFLAMVAAMHLCVITFYLLPNLFVGAHSRPWPVALQKRSYLNDGVCGVPTGRVCPGGRVALRWSSR